MDLDALDVDVLQQLRERPRVGVLELARTLRVARATVQARLDRMERAGVITGYGPDVDLRAAGFPVQALVTLEIAQGALDQVTQLYHEVATQWRAAPYDPGPESAATAAYLRWLSSAVVQGLFDAHHHAAGETHAHDFNFDWVDHHGHSHGDEMTPEELASRHSAKFVSRLVPGTRSNWSRNASQPGPA